MEDSHSGVNGAPHPGDPSTGDPQLDRAVHQWLSWDRNPHTLQQIRTLLDQGRVSDLRSRLGSRLSFGTAGLRAKMGAGFNRINDLTVIQASQGLYKYLARCNPELKERGVVIGFDTRAQRESGCSSNSLAKLAAAVFLTKDVKVHLFSSYVPTPYVPYAVMKLGAATGIMITASHNPKEDNGYKVYWSSGAQICSPRDKEILRSVSEELRPWSTSCWNQDLCTSSSLCTSPLDLIHHTYLREAQELCYCRDSNPHPALRVVHSSFHGVGHVYVKEVFEAFGLKAPIPVPEQQDPDPDFPTVPVPNPEEGAHVLELALRLADRDDAPLVLATDPDADRLAVAEKSESGEWRVFSGNEIAALLGWWMLLNHRRLQSQTRTQIQIQDQDQDQAVFMLATTVSSKIIQTICSQEGLSFQETLPGFKWIGNRIHNLLRSGHRVLFSFEESIGFLCGSMVPEKDGVTAAAVVAEMASFLRRQQKSLSDQLRTIYHTYGFHISNTSYVVCNDPNVVNRIFARIRNYPSTTPGTCGHTSTTPDTCGHTSNAPDTCCHTLTTPDPPNQSSPSTYPETCGNIKIVAVRDATTGFDSRQPNHRSVLPVCSSHMVSLWLESGAVATLRTSGTEPKIKIYSEICTEPGSVRTEAELEAELQKVTESLLDLLQPEKNQLLRPRV